MSGKHNNPSPHCLFSSHVTVVQRADDPQRRAPTLGLLVRIALSDTNARRLPRLTGFHERVGLVAARQKINLSDEPLVERVEEALERD